MKQPQNQARMAIRSGGVMRGRRFFWAAAWSLTVVDTLTSNSPAPRAQVQPAINRGRAAERQQSSC
jgi:hypothetical protein